LKMACSCAYNRVGNVKKSAAILVNIHS
jgi:hypothetical protein